MNPFCQINKIVLLFLIILFGYTMVGFAQVAEPEEDDPFTDDPFFNKPLNEWFSGEEIRERARRQTERIITQRGIDSGNRDLTGFGRFPGINALNKMYPAVRFNRVEALYFGLHLDRQLNWGAGRDLRPYGSIGYSFGRSEWLYTVGIERFFGEERKFKLGVSHHYITDTEDLWRVGWSENSLSSFFAGYDFMDYYSRRGTQIYGVWKPASLVEYSLAFMDDSYSSLDRNTRYSMFGKKSTYRDNPLIDEGRFQTIAAGLQFNPRQRMLSPVFTMTGDLYFEFAEDFGSGTDYFFRRYQTEIRTAYRIDKTALLRNRLRLGTVTGDYPDFKSFALGGVGAMRGRPFKSMQGSSVALLSTELSLGSNVGERGNRKWRDSMSDLNNLKFNLFMDMGWVNQGVPTSSGPLDGFKEFSFSDSKLDVGGGVNFNTLRFEIAWPASDLSSKPYFYVRLNQTF